MAQPTLSGSHETFYGYSLDFRKKLNSTKRPLRPSAGSHHFMGAWTGQFVEPFDIVHPVIAFDFSEYNVGEESYYYRKNTAEYTEYVDAPKYLVLDNPYHLDYWWRPFYYFVDNCVAINAHRWECHCTLDVLATFREELFQLETFVLRSSSGYNAAIADGQMSPTTNIVNVTPSDATLIPGFNSGNTDLIVRTIGSSGLNNYVLSPANVKAIMQTCFDAGVTDYSGLSWNAVEEAIQSLATAIINPSQFVQSVKWFPCDLASSTSDYVSFGYVLSTSQYPLAKDSHHATVAINKPAKYYNDWRDKDKRFTRLVLYLPCIGLVDVDPLYYDQNLVVEYGIDTNTGSCVVLLTAGGCPIGWYSGTAGVDIPIGGVNAVPALSAVGGAGLTALAGNPVGALSQGMNAIENVLSPVQTVFGASGNRAVWDIAPNIIMYRVSMGSTGSPRQDMGSPTMQRVKLGNLSGYVQCAVGNFEEDYIQWPTHDWPYNAAFKEVKNMINNALTSGFYIEPDENWHFENQTYLG